MVKQLTWSRQGQNTFCPYRTPTYRGDIFFTNIPSLPGPMVKQLTWSRQGQNICRDLREFVRRVPSGTQYEYSCSKGNILSLQNTYISRRYFLQTFRPYRDQFPVKGFSDNETSFLKDRSITIVLKKMRRSRPNETFDT